MCLKADKIDEGHRAITLKIAGPALDFENSLHSGNLSKCKQSQLTQVRNQKYVSKVFIALKFKIYIEEPGLIDVSSVYREVGTIFTH